MFSFVLKQRIVHLGGSRFHLCFNPAGNTPPAPAIHPRSRSRFPCSRRTASCEAELLANLFGGERRFALVVGAAFEQVKGVVQIFHLLSQ